MAPKVLESPGGPRGKGLEWTPAAFGSTVENEWSIVVDGRLDAADLGARIGAGHSVAVVVSGRPPTVLEQAPVPVRALRQARLVLASFRLRREVAGVERRLRKLAPVRRRLLIGDRNDGYALGVGRAGIRMPVEAVVVVSQSDDPTLLEQAAADAAAAVDAPLSLQHCRALAGGGLMAELATPTGTRWLLRLHEQVAAASVTEPIDRLLSSALPPQVRDRLVRPIARGRLGDLAWSIEEKIEGTHPTTMSAGLWRECAAFLAALGSVPVPADEAFAAPSLMEEAIALEPHLDEVGRRRLARLASESEQLLKAVPRRWGHGDFHGGNLLIRNGRLVSVVDWDAASPYSLPGLDLLHLIASTTPRLRRLPHGIRCGGPLRDLVLAGAGSELRAWLETQGVGVDPPMLEALVRAYWLSRVARDLRTFPDRPSRTEWIDLNLRRPLSMLHAPASGG